MKAIHRWVQAGAVAAAVCVTTAAAANQLHVPGDFPTIQQAINAAQNGDEVIVAPGTYNEAINFSGKAITVRSSDGPDVTTIDASGLNASVVTCASGEGINSILDGFTITGGNAFQGGGLRCAFSSPTIINCTFVGNHASSGGAVASTTESNPTLTNCRFIDNTADNSGGGVFLVNFSGANISDSFFGGNSASSGGAIWNSPGTFCHSHVSGSTFCENAPDNIFGSWVNQGGNEFLGECPDDCPVVGDLNCDGVVDVSDLLILLGAWGDCPDPDDCPADLNDDGVVDVSDLLILLGNWG